MVQVLQFSSSMTEQERRLTQRSDPILAEVIFGLRQPTWTRPDNKQVRMYWHQRKRLEIKNDVLMRKLQAGPIQEMVYQVIVPSSERKTVLELSHDHPLSGHLGSQRTLERMKEKFYWAGIASDVDKWCRECRDCATKKPPSQLSKAPLVSMPQASKPFEMLALDIVGPLKQTRRGNRFILVVADYFTRWPEAFALPNQEAETVATALVEHVISRFGIPLVILTDQGRNFESKLFQQLCNLLGVKKLRTSAYHPQTDGLVERFNRTLLVELSMYTSSNQEDWDEWIPHCLFAYRTSRHDSTGFSPAQLTLTFDPCVPLDLMKDFIKSQTSTTNPATYAQIVGERVGTCFAAAREKSELAKAAQKKYYDRRGFSGVFNVDDRVWLYNPAVPRGLSGKLHHQWTGPFTILEQTSPVP